MSSVPPRPLPWTAILLAATVVALSGCHGAGASKSPGGTGSAKAAAQPDDAGTVIRLSGTVEAVRASTVIVPRLAGQATNSLVITYLVPPGTKVASGDLLVQFDPQQQVRNAMDRRAEVVDLDGQIARKRADQAIARAASETALAEAEHDLDRARLDLAKNDFVSPVDAEKNRLIFQQDTAKVAQLREALALKQKAADADVRILEIRRERSERALKYAESNTELMAVHATFEGVVVIKSVFKGNGMSEVQEGDEVRPGLPILDIVDPTAMRVRARVNQADIELVELGRPAKIRLDAYPELSFDGRVDLVAPLGVTSSLTSTVRTFTALVSIQGMHPRLMPDLTASVELAGRPSTATLARRSQ